MQHILCYDDGTEVRVSTDHLSRNYTMTVVSPERQVVVSLLINGVSNDIDFDFVCGMSDDIVKQLGGI